MEVLRNPGRNPPCKKTRRAAPLFQGRRSGWKCCETPSATRRARKRGEPPRNRRLNLHVFLFAITTRTAAIAFLIAPGVHQGVLSLPEVAAVAHDQGIPVIVDAAAMIPPRDNLRRIIREGADLVIVSGGKCIRGPQSTGLLFGRSDLVEAALQLFMEADEEADFARETDTARHIADSLAGIPGIRTSVEGGDLSCAPPRWYYRLEPCALLRFERNRPGRSPAEVSAALTAGDPPIYAPHDRLTNGIMLNPFNLLGGEVDTLLRRVREELTA